jgi:hypothetical protein
MDSLVLWMKYKMKYKPRVRPVEEVVTYLCMICMRMYGGAGDVSTHLDILLKLDMCVPLKLSLTGQ